MVCLGNKHSAVFKIASKHFILGSFVDYDGHSISSKGFQFALIHGPNIPVSCAILLFTALNFTSTTSHINNCMLFLLWLLLFILSGVILPLIFSSILGTYQSGEFIFQCLVFLPFHTVHGVLKARILKWFTVPFSSGT